jgi:hypothetical protein
MCLVFIQDIPLVSLVKCLLSWHNGLTLRVGMYSEVMFKEITCFLFLQYCHLFKRKLIVDKAQGCSLVHEGSFVPNSSYDIQSSISLLLEVSAYSVLYAWLGTTSRYLKIIYNTLEYFCIYIEIFIQCIGGFTFYNTKGAVQHSQNSKILNPLACKDGIQKKNLSVEKV